MSEPKPRILVVEDDPSLQDFLTTFLEREGYEVHRAAHGGIARRMLDAEPFDAVVTDIVMPEVDGIEVLDHVKQTHADTPVILMTGRDSVRQAVELVRRGAEDYFKKPFDIAEMLHVIRKSLAHRRASGAGRPEAGGRTADGIRATASPPGAAPAEPACPAIIGSSAAMRPVFDMILKVADTHSTVLIQGSSGTGKELVAAAIHANSARRAGPFLPVHCGALPESLLESELFGHEKGSFTGAIARKEGVFCAADRGTLFLDEVSEMSAPLQVKLLRVLETGSFRRVGGVRDVHVDVRLVAATNRDLKEMLDRGLFRQDLYYRLNVFPILLPRLSERAGDIPLLVAHFLDRLARATHSAANVSPAALDLLCAYAWPGNVRELENIVERAVILCSGGDVLPEHLPMELRRDEPRARLQLDSTHLTFREAKGSFERNYVESLLARHTGGVAAAARAAGMSRAHFYELIRQHGVDLGRGGHIPLRRCPQSQR